MILTLDVGNSTIFGGVFDGDQLKITFRKATKQASTSDELGLFLRGVLRENNLDPHAVEQIVMCSVVPDIVHSLKNCCRKYFGKLPFVLEAGVKTGLKIKYHNPLEVGSDRIANAIAVTQLYPETDIIVIDFGTATTFDVVSAQKEYLGGIIVPGLRISMEALETKTAKLPAVEIVVASKVIGRSTVESIQSGLYHGTIGIVGELTAKIAAEAFGGKKPLIIGTGGFASLFAEAGIFDVEIPDLVLKGLWQALKMNV